jgi:hypothetical protein
MNRDGPMLSLALKIAGWMPLSYAMSPIQYKQVRNFFGGAVKNT